jgi:fructose-specific phosphotransferase system component IIB
MPIDIEKLSREKQNKLLETMTNECIHFMAELINKNLKKKYIEFAHHNIIKSMFVSLLFSIAHNYNKPIEYVMDVELKQIRNEINNMNKEVEEYERKQKNKQN